MTNIKQLRDSLIKDYHFNSSLILPEYGIELYTTYQGSDKLKYILIRNNEILFEGNDYRPSPMNGIDSLDAIVDLLGFLTVQPGDTADDYFKDYTTVQMDFARSYDAEVLKGLIGDFEDKNGEYHSEALKYFSEAANQFENL